MFKKIIASLVSLTVIVGSVSAYAAYTKEEQIFTYNQLGQSMVAEVETIPAESIASFRGTVTDINTVETDVFKATYVSVQNEEEKATIKILDSTYVVGDAEIAIGDIITGYYDTNGPMLMIYPPQYSAEVVVVENESVNVKFDRFDENLISSDGQLKLNLADKTVITLQDGSVFDGEIANRKLVVCYNITTRSIPAQTTPLSITVLFEKAVPVQQVTPPVAPVEPFEKTLAESPIRVNGEIIDAPNAFVSASNTIMVPLRAIAEALGYEVEWDNQTQSVTVGAFISLKIGEDSYIFARMAPIELKAAPELIGGTTFVPLSFFNMVVQAKTVGYFNGEITINME